jgi:hypothetical protein
MRHEPTKQACALLVCIAGLVQGCAIVGSTTARNGGEGIGYMLPRALLPVELVHDGTSFELRIASPVLVGDTEHIYALQRSGNVFTSDNVVVNVDPATGLLSGIDVKSEDQSASALVKLVSGLRAEAAGADVVTAVVVFRELLDPLKTDAELNARLNAAALGHVKRLKEENACHSGNAAACKNLTVLERELSVMRFEVAIADEQGASAKSAGPAATGSVDVASRPQTDCSAGFCYRINVPHIVTLSGPGVRNSAVFGLPNRSPTFVMPLERWAFVKTTHDVKLEGGVFKSITTDRPSSAFAVASVPFDIAKRAVSAASELIQLKVDLSGKEKALADAKVKEIEAKQALDKALLDRANGTKTEAALLGLPPDRDTPQLSIRIGAPSQLDTTKNLTGVKPPTRKKNGVPDANPPEAKPAAPAASGGQTSSGSGGSIDKKKDN